MHRKPCCLPNVSTLLLIVLAWLATSALTLTAGPLTLTVGPVTLHAGPLTLDVGPLTFHAGPLALGAQEITRTPEQELPPSLVPMPILFRQPETGTGFGSAATYFFRLRSPEDGSGSGSASPSTITAVAIYTTRSQIIAALEPNLRLRGDRLRIGGALEFVRFPTSFWGVGNDTGDEMEESYTTRALNIEAAALRQFRRGWYAGLVGRYARRKLSDLEPGGLLDQGAVPGTDGDQILGLGMAVSRDTRDRSTSPGSGGFHQLRLIRFASALGSDFNYTQLSLDMRRYLPLAPGGVLALRALGESLAGTAPFDVFPQLGGAELLRGYYGGRFRDRSLVALQAELRHHLAWRFGVVGFGALGQVAPAAADLRFDGMKATVGAGLRFAINQGEGLNIRADYGWGLETGTRAFYLSLGEVF
ncbi:MAG: BamA/TamA family outer membrane protein [Longimicrobiales bacterium]